MRSTLLPRLPFVPPQNDTSELASLQLFPSARSKPRACYAKLEACNARCRILAHTWPGPSEALTLGSTHNVRDRTLIPFPFPFRSFRSRRWMKGPASPGCLSAHSAITSSLSLALFLMLLVSDCNWLGLATSRGMLLLGNPRVEL